MHLQRVGDAENPQNAAHINGPQRAQNKALYLLVFCDVKAYVSCREYAGIPQSARVVP